MQQPIIDQRPVEQTAYRREIKGLVTMDINPSLQCQKNRSWIKGLGKNQQKEWTHYLQCLLSGATEPCPMDSEKQLRVYTSGRTMARHMWRVDKAPGHPHRNRNACLKVLRLSMGKICACPYGIRCELVKGFSYLHKNDINECWPIRTSWIICVNVGVLT